MSSKTVLFSDFDPRTVKEAAVRPMTNSVSKIVWLSHTSENVPIVLQTKMLRTPTGIREIKKFDENDTSPPKYQMEFALDPSDPEFKKLEEFDEKVVQLAMEAKSRWTKSKNYDKTSMDNMYTGTLRQASESWPANMRAKVPQSQDGRMAVQVYDLKRNAIPVEEYIPNSRNSYVSAIVKCTGVWLSGRGFGTTWKVEKLLVHSTQSSPSSFSFIETSETKVVPQSAPGGYSRDNAAAAAGNRGGEGEGEGNGGNGNGDGADDYLDDSE